MLPLQAAASSAQVPCMLLALRLFLRLGNFLVALLLKLFQDFSQDQVFDIEDNDDDHHHPHHHQGLDSSDEERHCG